MLAMVTLTLHKEVKRKFVSKLSTISWFCFSFSKRQIKNESLVLVLVR